MAGLKQALADFASVVLLLVIAFFPITSLTGNIQVKIARFLFGGVSDLLASRLFGETLVSDFSSDSKSMFSLLLILGVVSGIAVFVLRISKREIKNLHAIARLSVAYYIAFILLKYGVDKIFKAQFYIPEPNILFTQFGNLDKDILYWSTIGTSRTYSICLGVTELVCAILILWKRTRTLGLLFAFGVLANVFLVNIGFDISVKFFSAILLVMVIFALHPNINAIWKFFITRKSSVLKDEVVLDLGGKSKAVKTTVVAIFGFLVLYPTVSSRNFNDDKMPRSDFHGAYEIVSTLKNGKPSGLDSKRIFIHKKNYVIFESMGNHMQDFHFENIDKNGHLELEDYDGKKEKANVRFSRDTLIFRISKSNIEIRAKRLHWENMQALRDDPHIFIDDVR